MGARWTAATFSSGITACPVESAGSFHSGTSPAEASRVRQGILRTGPAGLSRDSAFALSGWGRSVRLEAADEHAIGPGGRGRLEDVAEMKHETLGDGLHAGGLPSERSQALAALDHGAEVEVFEAATPRLGRPACRLCIGRKL